MTLDGRTQRGTEKGSGGEQKGEGEEGRREGGIRLCASGTHSSPALWVLAESAGHPAVGAWEEKSKVTKKAVGHPKVKREEHKRKGRGLYEVSDTKEIQRGPRGRKGFEAQRATTGRLLQRTRNMP